MFLKNLLDSIRKIITPDEKAAWQAAAALGVTEALNKAGDSVYGAFVQGVKSANNYLKQKPADTADAPKYIESTVKKNLAQTLPAEAPWVKAQEDAQEALQPKTNRMYKSAPLADYIKARDLDDYAKGAYTTNKYLDQTPDIKTTEFQKTLNSFGIKDNFGNKLKEDGLYGPKTLQAADNFKSLQNNIKGQSQQTSNNQITNNQTNQTLKKPVNLFEQKNLLPDFTSLPPLKELRDNKNILRIPAFEQKNKNLTEADKQFEQQLIKQSNKEEKNKAGYIAYNKISDIDVGYALPEEVRSSPWFNIAVDFQLIGYDLSANLLAHSLKENPENLYFGNDSQVAEKIKQDSGFQKIIEDIIDTHKNEEYFETILEANNKFDKNDLFFSLHGVNENSIVQGYRQSDGRYIVKVMMKDTYDFKENNAKDFVSRVVNQAYLAQQRGEITPYDIYIEFVYKP